MNEQVEFMKAQKLAIRLEKLLGKSDRAFAANVLGLLLASFASTSPGPRHVITDVAARAAWFLQSAQDNKKAVKQ